MGSQNGNIILWGLQKLINKISTSMSIYSGFATRQQETTYDTLVQDLVMVLQKRILKFYNHEPTDEIKFFDIILHLHTQMSKMEENKYLEPKNSQGCSELLKFLLTNTEGIQQHLENKKINEAKMPKHLKPIPQIRSANTVNVRKLFENPHESFTQLNEPTSIGKIIRQINSSVNDDSLGESRQRLILNGLGLQKPDIMIDTPQTPRNNPEENKEEISRVLGAYKSSTRKPSVSRPRDLLLEYLQKNNKTSKHGYRKRSVKTRNVSTSGKHYNL